MYTTKFNQDLIDGQIGENDISLHFINNGYSIKKNNSNNIHTLRQYDFIAKKGNIEVKVEVKTDRWETYHYPTGNVIIETMSNGVPSGVYTSQSDYYVYWFPDQNVAYFIKTNELRQWLNINKKRIYFMYSTMGDGERSSGFVIPRKNLERLKFVTKFENKIR